MPDPELEQRLRNLPSVERLLQLEPLRSVAAKSPHPLALQAARATIENARSDLKQGNGALASETLAERAAYDLERSLEPSLRPLVNATGVVLHTNLGRAPLGRDAVRALDRAAGYANLEYDLGGGERGSRHAHVQQLIADLTGAEDGFAVNNNAGAVLLSLAALARDREVIISRGQLVEIGGSFRIPDVLRASGARLLEVGTTNRTRLSDYAQAIGPETAALMRVHTSNFRVLGFTEEPGIEALCTLGRERGLATIDDLGSGVIGGEGGGEHGSVAPELERLAQVLTDEPSARASVEAGADVVCFSGDKLLGGPQAGLVAGRREAVERLRSHPLARALRIDKLSLAALEATLRLHRDPERAREEIPVLRMLSASESELAARAERLRAAIVSEAGEAARVEIVRATGRAGGGALPLLELEGPVVSVQAAALDGLHRALREHDPPVIARLNDGALLLDPRTMTDREAELAARAVAAGLRSRSS